MPQLPFDIPKSLASYVESFESDPLKATTRLKEQLKKRGSDAVGHFVLAWFYHLKGMDDNAVEHALKAKICAPGSPFFEKLHYYLAHPNTFEAWTPPADASEGSQSFSGAAIPGPVLDLDALIDKLAKVENERIDVSEHDNLSPASIDGISDQVDDIVSETLANIHETQGKTDAAIRTYKRLKELNKEKREFYLEQISRLKKMREQQEDAEGEEE